MISAHVSWPSAPLTNSLVRKALNRLKIPVNFVNNDGIRDALMPLQWSAYDEIDHELLLVRRETLLASSYTFRKALIRKHFLSRIIQNYLKKRPESVLTQACPRTFEIEISFADELAEMWTDELWELGIELDSGSSWWIIKPGMADRGMGIRLFNTREDLLQIFESFEQEDSDEEELDNDEIARDATAVVASQLRHFVIQEYISKPLLLDPTETMDNKEQNDLIGRKFHLRAYCVCSGDIKLYLSTRILALFSSAPYTSPADTCLIGGTGHIDLRPHLTNSALQTKLGESNVRLLDELEGCHLLSENGGRFSRSDIDGLVKQMAEVLAETFQAALQNPVHFQVLPNAFELFGVDFLVSHTQPKDNSRKPFQVKILEINSEPAIELTGPRLTWVLEDIFASMAKVCVEPFFTNAEELWEVGECKQNFLKCLDKTLRPKN